MRRTVCSRYSVTARSTRSWPSACRSVEASRAHEMLGATASRERSCSCHKPTRTPADGGQVPGLLSRAEFGLAPRARYLPLSSFGYSCGFPTGDSVRGPDAPDRIGRDAGGVFMKNHYAFAPTPVVA